MLSIAGDLFVGNHLEDGEVVVDGHCRADLSRIGAPLVIFCSNGDNITPPHQALGWLKAVYPTTADLVAAGQRVVYLLHQHGPPRSSSPPQWRDGSTAPSCIMPNRSRHSNPDSTRWFWMTAPLWSRPPAAQFQPRRLEDLPFDANPAGFDKVEALSEITERFYAQWVSPWVRFVTPESARASSCAAPHARQPQGLVRAGDASSRAAALDAAMA
jgi:hypothetical protein